MRDTTRSRPSYWYVWVMAVVRRSKASKAYCSLRPELVRDRSVPRGE
ncbi:hypothetical protein ACN268_27105 [Micromonospora sp. WMMD735]